VEGCDHKWVKRFVRLMCLNADLFRVHLANDPGCICGCAFEDAIHFILECCLYNEAREELKGGFYCMIFICLFESI
jgi:hypothetical protein